MQGSGKPDRAGKVDRPVKPESDGRAPPVVTRRVAAEAATWIARLHGPSRSPEMERAFRDWVSQSEAHGYAFERCTDVWTDVQSLTPAQVFAGFARRDMKAAIARERLWQRIRWPVFALLVVVVMAAAYGVYRWRAVDVYRTEVGGQQQVLLADGTRMSLNTETKVRVELDSARRSVTLDAGEVMFEVAKDPLRPFVVRAAGSEVVAVGTVFTVRVAGHGVDRDAALSVVLVEGEVSVRPALSKSTPGMATKGRLEMRAGDRLRLAKASAEAGTPVLPQVDRPPVDSLVAWKRGEAIFGDLSLQEAVGEMNRYTRTPIVLVGDVAELRISGRYHTSDVQGFAQAVAALHGLAYRASEDRLELARPQ